ncbi:hypothetical protein [Microbacterium enclense]|uniref:Uncharacterized protein n=1 Tax=Microbacterium enclense TaxID=993073 RepID=A0A1G6NRV5_9MICO|nr:hypothetical protein [Microbacterium enclense]KSU52870.1 hypothetical protein AS029_12740 [Microbacterium enclense]SDC70468.1 hypothetical protein SAMN05216418_2827 [Microbacterium enclense]
MSDRRVPRRQLEALSRRDGFVCVWTATEGDRLVPQHRQGGMGGRPDKHRTENLLWLDSLLNGGIEADADLAEIAKAYGIKVPIWVPDVAAVPVFFAHEHAWFLLEGDERREISAVEALDRMHQIYGDEYFAWKARADQSPRAALLALRGSR